MKKLALILLVLGSVCLLSKQAEESVAVMAVGIVFLIIGGGIVVMPWVVGRFKRRSPG